MQLPLFKESLIYINLIFINSYAKKITHTHRKESRVVDPMETQSTLKSKHRIQRYRQLI